MPKFAANLTMLYNELDFMERFAAAANDGFTGVEYLFPYSYPQAEIAHHLKASGLQQVLFNLPAGDWAAGDRGVACDPARVAEFRAGVPQALDYASALECTRVNCLAGIVPPNVGPATAHETFVNNLRYAARECAVAGVTLLIEPVNTRDVPDFFLSRSGQALDIIEEVGSTALKLQYDVYHMQRMEGELATTVTANLERIAHVQVADNPGRHEPGTGEINYPYLFERLDGIGYDGWVGCEYVPIATTSEGLAWLHTARRKEAMDARR